MKQLRETGALHFPAALDAAEIASLQALADRVVGRRPGHRIVGEPLVDIHATDTGSLGRVAVAALGPGARPVRAVLFDKTRANNWAVPWHQDRTIAVTARREVSGFGPWSRKSGVDHVEPPFEITAGMVTLRAHLDDCDTANAPLFYVPGSHRLGKIPSADVAALAHRCGHATSLAQAGDVWLYATPIVHGSEAARDPRRRRVLQIDFAAVDLPGGLQWLGIGRALTPPQSTGSAALPARGGTSP